MSVKRKISVRKILQLFVTIVVTCCCVIAMVSASRIEDNKTLKRIAIHIKNDKKYHFIEQQEIMDLAITQQQIDISHTPVSKLDINAMERLIMADPWVANAQVYIDNDCVLQMNITQRIPVVRIFDKSSRTYYLDTTMSIMPVSNNYIYYTTVVTNVPDINNDSASWALRKDIISMVRTIQADSFWSAQVSQVIIDSPGMYELVPVLGDQRIIFGDASGIKEKLNNLFVFYKNVLNRIGWDKYEILDLRFRGQVVASPSLPYKGPVDKAVVNMNWINSIVETEARNDAMDSVKTADSKGNQATAKDAKKTNPGKKPVLASPVKKNKINPASGKNLKTINKKKPQKTTKQKTANNKKNTDNKKQATKKVQNKKDQ